MSLKAKSTLLFILDLCALSLALGLTVFIDKGFPDINSAYFLKMLIKHFKAFAGLFFIITFLNYIEGMYSIRRVNPRGIITSILRLTLFSEAAGFIYFYLFFKGDITPKTNLIIFGVFFSFLFYLNRKIFFHFLSASAFKEKVFCFGDLQSVEILQNHLINRPYLGLEIYHGGTEFNIIEVKKFPPGSTLAFDRLLIANPQNAKSVYQLLSSQFNIIELSELVEKITGKIPIKSIDETWFIYFCGQKQDQTYFFLKNFIDRFVAICLMILTAPFLLILFTLLLIFHGRPIFFNQVRVGQFNRPFTLYKLRTMRTDAESSGAKWASQKDSRVTLIGKFLRKTRIDELPQLINIFRGEMSLVGPRPERPEFIDNLLSVQIPFYNQRHLVKPGVTGWAQVNFPYGASVEDSKEKLQFDLYYIKNQSIWLDLSIILKTIKTIISGAGH